MYFDRFEVNTKQIKTSKLVVHPGRPNGRQTDDEVR